MTEEMKPPFLGGVTDLARFFVRWLAERSECRLTLGQ